MAGWLGRRVALWHGDVADSVKQRLAADPPDVLLTTPESLEAMLISGRVDHSWAFANLRAAVVDELHAFAGDDRGWHLLGVLSRLTRLAGHPIQRIGLSATIGNPDRCWTGWRICSASRRTVVNPPAMADRPPRFSLTTQARCRTPRLSFPGCTRAPNDWCSAIRAPRLSNWRSHCAAWRPDVCLAFLAVGRHEAAGRDSVHHGDQLRDRGNLHPGARCRHWRPRPRHSD